MTDEQNDNVKQEDAAVELKKLRAQLATMEDFITRRFSELSMEINATSQQLDMAEEGMGKRFSEVLDTLGSITYSGDGLSPANAGVELDAVIDTTEEAANKILDAAEGIAGMLGDEKIDWDNQSERQTVLASIGHKVQDILVACSFQDITGQRIRKTLENIQTVENELIETFEGMGIKMPKATNKGENKRSSEGLDQSKHATQDDIDALFAD